MRQDEYGALRREYARIAPGYDSRWSFYVEATNGETVRRLAVAPGERLLDVGCGTGALLEQLARAESRVELAGIDLSAEMLGIARRRLGSDIDLRQAPAEALPFADAAFDVVVSASVFHFIRNPRSALGEIDRVLKPSGRLVVTDWCDDYIACRILDLFLRLFSPGHFRTYGSRELRRLLEREGWADVRVERYKISWLWGLMTATASKQAVGDSSGKPAFDRP